MLLSLSDMFIPQCCDVRTRGSIRSSVVKLVCSCRTSFHPILNSKIICKMTFIWKFTFFQICACACVCVWSYTMCENYSCFCLSFLTLFQSSFDSCLSTVLAVVRIQRERGHGECSEVVGMKMGSQKERDSRQINTFWLEGDREVGEVLRHCITHAHALPCAIVTT